MQRFIYFVLWTTLSVVVTASASGGGSTLDRGVGSCWVNSLGMEFVPVPGTEVLFCKWETRVKDYQAFVGAIGRAWLKPDFERGPTHPAVNVNWDDAKAFCQWLTEKERREGKLEANQEYRLPKDWEWSVAVGVNEAQNGTPEDKNMKVAGIYPWGTQWPPPNGSGNYGISLNCDTHDRTSPVGSFNANANGLYDVGGNAWEYCEDFFDGQIGARVLQGGSWSTLDPKYLLSSCHGNIRNGDRIDSRGFRMVVALSSTEPRGGRPKGAK